MNENRMITDTLKVRLGIKTDAAIAELLGITKDTMSMMKNEKIGISIENRLAMMDLLNCSGIENLSKRIREDYLRVRIIETIGETSGENKSLIDLFKAHQGFKTDEEISQIIGIKRNSISMIRSGKSQLGPLPRLKMLSIVDGVSIDDVKKALVSKEGLLSLLKRNNIDNDQENNTDSNQYEKQKNQQIVNKANKLAGLFFKMSCNGVAREGYEFNEAYRSDEVKCWDMAVAAYDQIEGTDVSKALEESQQEYP